eukprot:TRINITY_DN3060_c0_g1_i3.p1 TRINITY_DN3060_c0_g1~~TRINITY_DN3060_c0_g1_i3.p1  ORF type:complete len:56 (+),score=13.58 TRINITY_DN3060_c0_g1_i3:23-169(+)
MVLIADLEQFCDAAEAMYQDDPLKFRYSTKYRHKEGKFALKATNDVVV